MARGRRYEPPFVWQEDNAPSHLAKTTKSWTSKFWPFETMTWPAHSADLQVLDYSIWDMIAAKLRGNTYRNVQKLKRAISDAIKQMDEHEKPHIESAIRSFPKRLRLRVTANGGHFEH
mmetsp:Transcript_11660/g.13121  ORF Transcript_11660/g.13121 Transcript_11660/m.13121 type:complete len:118 (-) Transcript_11660:12-365(-)